MRRLCLIITCLFAVAVLASPASAQTSDSAKALKTAEQKLAQNPDDAATLKTYAEMATWNGDYGKAADAYKKLIAIKPGDDDIVLALARVEAWQGHLDSAAENYESYVSRHPNDSKALLDYAYTQSWRGDFASALNLLDRYKKSDGSDKDYKQAQARFLAGGSYSDQALFVADDVLRGSPYNFHAQFSRTLALKEAGRMEEALDSLKKLEAMPGDDKSKQELMRVVKTPLRPQVRADISYSGDSDKIHITTVALEGQYAVNPQLYLRAGAQTGYLDAKRGSGLDTIRGNDRVNDYAAWVGARYALNDKVWLNGRVGRHDTNATDGTGIFEVSAEYRPSDQLYLNATVDRDFHAVSPRAISLDITRTQEQLRATWRPDLDYTIEANAGYADFSDGNERWNLGLAPRRSVLRTEDYNLDLGVSGRWFGFSDEMGHGYYDPATYQQYLVTAFSYFKLSPDSGLSIIVAPGIHKDESMSTYKFSGNFAAEGTVGIYDDWMLKARAGWVNNIGVSSQSYRRFETGLSITRRF